MKPTEPYELPGPMFSRVENGYSPAEVDAYIQKLNDCYTRLYRERYSSTENEILEEAYLKADAIIAAAQTSSEAILRNLKEKADVQQKILEDMRQAVFNFQNELFEKYRLHIEWIEHLIPVQNEDEWLSPADSMERIAEKLRQDIAAQYELPLLPCEEEKKEPPRPARNKSVSDARPRQTKKSARADKKPAPGQQQLTVMELLTEYEDHHASRKARNVSEEQFALNFEDGSLHAEQ